jgi:hypothetical protein
VRKYRNRRKAKPELISKDFNAEAAEILFGAVVSFLRKNKLDSRLILKSAKRAQQQPSISDGRKAVRRFRSVVRAYEEMGGIVATWYSHPRFLDKAGNPKALSVGRGSCTIRNLVRSAGAEVPHSVVVDLMHMSPTIAKIDRGELLATSRFFSLPGFELLRAGIVIERFLETLQRNSEIRDERSKLIFERSCYANGIGFRKVGRLLRDIKERGTAFMDAVDGQIELNRSRTSKQGDLSELGVFMFAWMRPPRKTRRMD